MHRFPVASAFTIEFHLQYPDPRPEAIAMTKPAAGNAPTANTRRAAPEIAHGRKLIAAWAATISAHGMTEAARPCAHQGQ